MKFAIVYDCVTYISFNIILIHFYYVVIYELNMPHTGLRNTVFLIFEC